MPNINLAILNQKSTPAFFADTFANRPAPSFVGRVFISTDTFDLYRDTGTAWVLLSPSSSGTITGTGTATYIPLFTGSTSIGDSALIQITGTADLFIGSFAVPYDVIGYGNYYGTKFIINGGSNNQILVADGTTITAGTGISISAGQISATGSGGVTGTGAAGQVSFWNSGTSITGTNNLYWNNVSNFLGINTNTPAHPIDVHSSLSTAITLNQTSFGNDNRIAFQNSGTTNWRIGNFYNFGLNDFAVQDASLSINRFTIKSSSGQTFVGTDTTSSGLFVVNNSSSDSHLVILGASAPSFRIRNAGIGATQQFGLGLATTINNFIQGTTGGEMCIFNDSTTAQPILFGIANFGLTNEVGRFTSNGNFLIGSSINGTPKVQITDINTQLSLIYSGATQTTFRCDSSGGLLLDTTSSYIINYIGSIERFRIKTNTINISNIPTSSAGLVTGDIYSNAGILTIV
jgi:hypothetical protein